MTYRLPATVTSCHDALLPTDALLINFTSSARPRETRKREVETSRRGGISRGRDNRALIFVVDEPRRGRRLPALRDLLLRSGFDEVSRWSSRVWTFLFYFIFFFWILINQNYTCSKYWLLILKYIVKDIVSINFDVFYILFWFCILIEKLFILIYYYVFLLQFCIVLNNK